MNKDEIRAVANLIGQLQDEFRWDGSDDRVSRELMQAYRSVLSYLMRNIGNTRPANLKGLDERFEGLDEQFEL